MFPMALPARLIECFTRRGMTVLDPFTRWDAHTKSLDAASVIPAGEL
jgi:DNA modification methylase